MFTDILSMVLMATLMVMSCLYGARDKLDPIWLFTILHIPRFLVRPAMLIFDLDTHQRAFLLRDDVRDLAREAVLVFAIAQCAFVIGYASGGGRTTRWLAAKLPGFHSVAINRNRLKWIVIVGCLVSVGLAAYFVQQTGGATDYMFEARHGLFAGWHLLEKIPLVVGFASALFLYAALKAKQDVTLAASIFVIILVTLFLKADRGGIIYTLMVLGFSYHYGIRRLSMGRVALAGVSLLVLLVVLGAAREAAFGARGESLWDSMERAQFGGTDTSQSAVSSVAGRLNLAAVDHFLIILQDFDSGNYHYGEDFIRGIQGAIPRFLWPDKPEYITVGQWFRNHYAPGSAAGKPITAIGNFYLNFGYPGVVLGLVLSGLLCRLIWEYVRGSGYKAWAVIFYLAFFFETTSWGVYTTTTLSGVIFWLVPLTAMYWLILERPSAIGDSSNAIPLPAETSRVAS